MPAKLRKRPGGRGRGRGRGRTVLRRPAADEAEDEEGSNTVSACQEAGDDDSNMDTVPESKTLIHLKHDFLIPVDDAEKEQSSANVVIKNVTRASLWEAAAKGKQGDVRWQCERSAMYLRKWGEHEAANQLDLQQGQFLRPHTSDETSRLPFAVSRHQSF